MAIVYVRCPNETCLMDHEENYLRRVHIPKGKTTFKCDNCNKTYKLTENAATPAEQQMASILRGNS